MSFPNPTVKRTTVTALFPYSQEGREPTSNFRECFAKFSGADASLPAGWEKNLPKKLRARRLDRWYFREVRNLLFNDRSFGGGVTPKFVWVEHPKYHLKIRNPRTNQNMRVAIIQNFQRVAHHPEQYLKVQEIGLVDHLEMFTLIGEIGTVIVGVRWQQEDTSLRNALEAIHFASLSDESNALIAFLPNNAAKVVEELNGQSVSSAGDSAQVKDKDSPSARTPLNFEATPAELQDCLLLPPIYSHLGIPSLVDRVWEQLLRPAGFPVMYLGSQGRVPILANVDIEENGALSNESTESQDTATTLDHSRWRQIEWLCARFLRHPDCLGEKKTWILPLEGGIDVDPAIQIVRPSLNRSLMCSSEGFASLGSLATDFDPQWNDRTRYEFFFAYLIALHQSIVLQDISWRSYSRSGGNSENHGSHDALFEFFAEFDTTYNFSRISNHVTMQQVYEAARKTLGVAETCQEVRDELQNWIEKEQREEQRNLNALAVIAILVSTATFFISLNLTLFNKDSLVAPDSVWLWLPTAFVVLIAAGNQAMRRNLARAIDFLIGTNWRSWRGRLASWWQRHVHPSIDNQEEK